MLCSTWNGKLLRYNNIRQTPTEVDVKTPEVPIKEMTQIAAAWQGAILGVGGGQDTGLHNAGTLLNTLSKKVKEAEAHDSASSGIHHKASPVPLHCMAQSQKLKLKEC